MKTMKKVSSLFLALLMIAGMCSVPAMAAETGCINVFSDTVYKFDGDSVAAYGTVEGIGESYAGNSIEIVPEEEGSSNNVLKLTQGNAGAAVKIRPFDNSTGKSDLHLAFDIKKSGTDTQPFYLDGWSGSVFMHIFRMQNNTIYLNNTAVYTYELGQWYHIDLKLNLANGDTTLDGSGDYHYAKLSVTKSGDSEPTVIDLPYGLNHRPDGNERNIFKRVYIGWYTKTADGGTVMIDNYMQNDIAENPVTVSMDSHDDNFDTLPQIDAGGNGTWNQSNVASRTGWTFTNAKGSTTASIVDGKLRLYTANNAFPEIAKIPFWSTPDVRHRISFKMNGHGEGQTQRSVRIKFSANSTYLLTNTSSTNASYYGKDLIEIINFKDGRLSFFGKSGIDLKSNPNFMYPIEIVYDAKAKICVATVTDQFGVQHEADLSAEIQELMNTLRKDGVEDGKWYNLGAFGIRFPSGVNGNGVCDIDDFNWDIFNDNTMTATKSVKYADKGESPLDETVTFDFDRPVKSIATVAITSNGETVTTPYKTSVESGVLSVKFSDLDLNTDYAVTVSGITPMESDVTQAETTYTKEFTTANAEKAISATNPEIVGDLSSATISSGVTSYYAEGRPALLIAALYKDKKLVRVVTEDLEKATFRAENTLSLNVSGTDYDEIRSFVWSGFAQLLPYSGVSQLQN